MNTNEKIIEAALKLFAEQGYDSGSVEKIAKEVGIRKSSLYFHFKTKEEIFMTVFENVLNEDVNNLSELIKSISDYKTEEKLHSIFHYYSNLYITHSEKVEVIFLKRALLFPPAFLKEKVQIKFEEYEDSLNKIITSIFENGIEEKIIKKLDIKDLLVSFYCIIDGMFFESNLYTRKECVSRVESIWNIYWAGISANVKKEV